LTTRDQIFMRYQGKNIRKKSRAGYTLLELMVVISIVSILAVVVVPGMQDGMRRNAKDSYMLDLLSAVALARSEAVTQGRAVSICRSVDQAVCTAIAGGDWSVGWIVFDDAGTAGTVDGADSILQSGKAETNLSIVTLKTALDASFAADFLQFNEEGFLKTSATGAYFKFCGQDNDASTARAVWLSNTGRSTLSTDDADGVHNNLAGNNLTCP
jgi:prepilin-type N-terminal cleavage/methylation domain-containing protein